MFTIDDAALGADELTLRVQDDVRRLQQRTSSPPAGNTSEPADQTAAQWAIVHQAITRAEGLATIGTSLPPMHRMTGWRRLVAVPLAKLVLRAAALVTRDQTSFNVETTKALRLLGETIGHQQRVLEHRHVAAQKEQETRLERLAGETTRQRAAIDKRLAAVDDQLHGTEAALRDTTATSVETTDAVRQAAADLTFLRTQVTLQERRLAVLLDEIARAGRPADTTAAAELAHMLDPLYVRFEDRFRGSRDDIKGRARIHLGPVRAAGAGTPERPILDVACGRGEWLEVLQTEGLVARGIDANRILAEENALRGLDVVEADALSHLRALPDTSVGAVTAFHFLEHLPFDVLVAFLDEVLRILQPGGVAIFETPNPKNLLVGACYFWVDPTHRNPIFPETLTFLVETRGFVRAAVRELHPVDPSLRLPDDGSAVAARLNEYLFGPQDFAVICHRA